MKVLKHLRQTPTILGIPMIQFLVFFGFAMVIIMIVVSTFSLISVLMGLGGIYVLFFILSKFSSVNYDFITKFPIDIIVKNGRQKKY